MAQVWEMDAPEVMMALPIERSELTAHPMLRVNKPANLMAVSTANNTIKILANTAGMQLLGVQKPKPAVAAPVRAEAVAAPGAATVAAAPAAPPAAAVRPAARSSTATVRPAPALAVAFSMNH